MLTEVDKIKNPGKYIEERKKSVFKRKSKPPRKTNQKTEKNRSKSNGKAL